ncbi:DUF6817 domain-containing protein [Actinokineospora iranica]|uniref:DUF6817 domain-containing protein n=1 Tax=Actinokineospora iranica TaxID=1271860 RepID=A0A1G6P9C1_9PSEU|nr:hypothetical protein [Actinokineospora iranica]SDC76204.1 hypothetical protein SAMN05216174_104160 [Actinokineospora iranica]
MIEDFLAARGAAELAHPGGTLLAHLGRTRDALVAWGARPALQLAGFAHAAYGTAGFPQSLVSLAERHVLVDLVGGEAEAIVYAYCALDREFSYPRLLSRVVRDRFTGVESRAEPALVRDLVELTFANELDVLAQSPELRKRHAGDLKALLSSWSAYASVPAAEALERL